MVRQISKLDSAEEDVIRESSLRFPMESATVDLVGVGEGEVEGVGDVLWEGRGSGDLVGTPLLQTNFLPDLIH